MSGWGSGIAAVSAGGDIEIGICALSTTGKATCEGDDYYGGLGNGTSGVAGSSTPVGVSGLSSGVRKISVGVYTSCAVTSARGVDCWGHNDYGQLGNGSTAVEATRPVAVKL
jgi:alpha-tubulin suppressor-like RCC1 family protein